MKENEQSGIGKEAMNNALYYKALGYDPDTVSELGGQELILADIVASLHGMRTIHIPLNCPSLEEACFHNDIEIVTSVDQYDATYWGTPTIVDDEVLFPDCLADPADASKWNKEVERLWSRTCTAFAIDAGCKRIVTGLGSGDISVEERLQDMGGGRVVSHKHFGDFEDWVLVRNLV